MSLRIFSSPGYDSFACTMYWMIGIELVENLITRGVLAPSGRLSFTMSTNDRMSATASSSEDPHSNSMATREMLSLLVEVNVLSPSTELSVFSIIFVTLVSTSLAFAPAYVVMTQTYGGSISGNWSIGSFLKENIPNTITAMKMSDVVIGLSIAVLNILIA